MSATRTGLIVGIPPGPTQKEGLDRVKKALEDEFPGVVVVVIAGTSGMTSFTWIPRERSGGEN